MAVNARTEEFQHIEVFDKPALFTNGRIARDTVPKGWYCYDIRGSDDDPGELCYMEENVVVNHAGSVLMPEKLAMPKFGRLDVRDELGFLDEGNMTLREFCEAHQFPYPAENMKFHIRPARPEEAGLFYTPHPEEDKRLGTIFGGFAPQQPDGGAALTPPRGERPRGACDAGRTEIHPQGQLCGHENGDASHADKTAPVSRLGHYLW